MPNFRPQELRNIGYQLFQAAGCSEADTHAVVDHLVESNLFGHDSHGAIRFYEYASAVREGRFNPSAKPKIEREHPTVAIIDAGGAMGQVGATFATELAIKKARKYGIGTVALRNTSHIGRVGGYPLMAAREGFISQIFVNAGDLGYQIAPFGGISGRLSTNPLAFGAPRREADPILVDMTTSTVAEGKLRVARNQGDKVPLGWIIDADGNPCTDPHTMLADPPGAILPLGGPVAHKGTALSIMVEILGGALSGLGCAKGARKLTSNGVLLTVYNIEHFVDPDRYYDEVEILIRHIKSSDLAPGFTEVLLPGEPEFRCARRLGKAGIEIDEITWKRICEEALLFGLDLSQYASV